MTTQLDPLIQSAQTLAQQGSYEQAIPIYEQALAQNPPTAAALLGDLGVAFHQTGQLKKAVDAYGRSLRLVPNAPTLLVLRGAALLDLHRYQEALKDFNEAIRLSPYLEDAYWGRGQAYLGLNDAEWAMASFSRAIELDPDAADYYEARAAALRQLGKTVEARQDLAKAAVLRSTD